MLDGSVVLCWHQKGRSTRVEILWNSCGRYWFVTRDRVVRWGRGANLSFTQHFGCFGFFKWSQPTHSPLLFQGRQRPLQEKGSPVPSAQRAVPRTPWGGPLPPQSLRLQRQQQRLLTRQSQEPAISLTARQEYVELRVSPPLMQCGTHLCPSWHKRNLII